MAVILDGSRFSNPIKCVEIHTTGEPTRIVYEGLPDLQGTLLEQRAQAKRNYDHIRRRLILEPRGHYDMYSAVLRSMTELTESGEAHVGTLFMTNDGFSTMCGHATITLGRFLLDTSEVIFPQRAKVKHDPRTNTALLKLHAPCGLLESWGFDGLKNPNITEINLATKQLKAAIKANPQLRRLFQHPDHDDLGFRYSIIVVDKGLGVLVDGSQSAETGICFFADQQIDRSPTGSGVTARVALAVAKSDLELDEKRSYHSLVSNSSNGKGAFIGSAIRKLGNHFDHPIVKVRVEGFAYYTGLSNLFVEKNDLLGDDGFIFGRPSNSA